MHPTMPGTNDDYKCWTLLDLRRGDAERYKEFTERTTALGQNVSSCKRPTSTLTNTKASAPSVGRRSGGRGSSCARVVGSHRLTV